MLKVHSCISIIFSTSPMQANHHDQPSYMPRSSRDRGLPVYGLQAAARSCSAAVTLSIAQ